MEVAISSSQPVCHLQDPSRIHFPDPTVDPRIRDVDSGSTVVGEVKTLHLEVGQVFRILFLGQPQMQDSLTKENSILYHSQPASF